MSEKISVLMPVYNRVSLIEDAILSIRRQTHENLELIIYDDGSKDETVSLIHEHMIFDGRIRLIKGKENKGVPYARNRLLDACQTKYACWQDSDDMSNIYRLKKQFETVMSLEASLVYSFYRIYRDTNSGLHLFKEETKKGFATTMFEVDKSVRFNEDLKLGGEDHDWLRRMEEKMGGFAWVQEVLYYIRFHNDRIGVWKRKIKSFDPAMSYEQILGVHR